MRARRISAAAFAVWGATMAAQAGPIDPPPGPIAPTGPTLIFSLPYVIDQPGAYALGRNLTSTGGVGISISVSNVTLDLGGLTLSGAGGGTDAVVLVGNLTNVTVRNGQIVNWTGAGVWDGATPDRNVRVERVSVTGTGFGGIECVASGVTVQACQIAGGSPGVAVGQASRVIDTRVTAATDFGLIAQERTLVTGCVIENAGSVGVLAGANVTLRETTVTGSAGDSVVLGAGSMVSGCLVTLGGQGGAPLSSSVATRYSAVTARSEAPIFVHPIADRPATVIDRRTGQARPDALASILSTEGVTVTLGVVLAEDSLIESSMITGHAGVGLLLGARSTARGVTSDLNFGDGIVATEDGVIERCRASGNGGNGIVLGPSGSRCVENYVSENALDGILVNDPFVSVFRNTLELDELNNAAQAPLVGPLNDVATPLSNWST
ncbi:MAG: right-handed parallel beta-helix repeat-containing protein [Planctomycetota bacterium]|nr:MAG: right-handed parallel beta-helix repeat-containing protein [Planctomycetota bacterium]